MSELLTLFERELRRFQPYFQHNEIHPRIHIEAIQRGAKVVGLKISRIDSEGRVLRCYRFAASKTRKASWLVKALNDRLMHVELREFLKAFRGKARAGMQMGGYGSTGFSVDICPKKAPWPLEQARIGVRMLPGLGAEPKGVIMFGIPTTVDAAAKAIRIMKQEHIDLCCTTVHAVPSNGHMPPSLGSQSQDTTSARTGHVIRAG